ncbi:MAG: hypothetical protein AAGU19_20045 [Prolixibacteraceae bacterium]
MAKIKYHIIQLFLVLFLSSLIVSCDEDPELSQTTDRLFRPALFTTGINGNEVTFSWVPISNATYILEISRDSLLFQTDLQVVPLGKVTIFEVKDLWSASRYSARIKAVSDNSAMGDSEYNQITFRTGTENIFFAPTPEEISATSVILRWDDQKAVSKIVVSSPEVAEYIRPLSEADIENGHALISGLNAGVTYVFKVYNGEMLRGTISVKTKTE